MDESTVERSNPLAIAISNWLPEFDFGVLQHGLLSHGRDYEIVLQDSIGPEPGAHRLVFTHVVAMTYESRVSDEAWSRSWDDVFLDYELSKDLDGYIWGTDWSLAYPGLQAPETDPEAEKWSRRLGKQMYSMTLETDRFALGMTFHSLRTERLSEEVGLMNQVIFSLDP